MFSILRVERPDVVHTHSVDIAFVVSAAARFYGIPLVHTFHIVTFYDANQSAFRRKIELWLAKQAKPRVATVPNVYDVKKLRSAGLTQTVLLPNGVDLDFWKMDTYPQEEEGEEFTFLTIGRLERQKGYEHLIRAASVLAHTLPVAFRVVVAGAGSQETYLRELIRTQGVEDVVTLVGRKSAEEVKHLYSKADAAVFPSLYETTPVTVLEAWAAGVPVIVSSVGILRDIPADFGAAYVVPVGDEDALAEAMGQCITDARTRVGVAAKGYDEAAKYIWPTIAQSAEAIYRGAR
jgi:glycosyltransferase involved in cell wall biosynthesis